MAVEGQGLSSHILRSTALDHVLVYGESDKRSSILKPSGTQRRDLTCTMKLWPFACLVACFVGAWVPTVHAQGAIEDCCLGYQRNTKWHILRRATRYRDQLVSGSCNLRAVIFY
uniref:Chemokine interleukin-8-like domain-containing protein n=1 Tax=Nannospalax galili TaxID=1026970 RepID=A0A8C6WAH9_NANGA